jgi:hypothetical protein
MVDRLDREFVIETPETQLHHDSVADADRNASDAIVDTDSASTKGQITIKL